MKEDDYVKKEVSAPRLQGWTLLAFTKLLGTFLGRYIRSFLLWKNGYTAFERMDDEEVEPMFYPSFKDENCSKPPVSSVAISSTTSEEEYWDVFMALQEQLSSEILSEEGKSVILSLHKGYLEGSKKPSELAREFFQVIDEWEAMQPPMNFMCQERRHWSMKLAKESDERYQKGNPKSILDGVLFSVKDQFDIEGFETSYGTSFLAACRHPGETIPCVRILLKAGAILVGKTTMHEVGLGTVGINTKQGVPRNPWNPEHLTGGSSGGSASMVASKLVAFSIGADGGGSIRIPSSFCGVIGLKTTFNRVPIGGCMHVCHTVGAIGPIASTIQDCAIVYAIMAALQDEKERWKSPWLNDFSVPLFPKIAQTLHGWKIGIYRPFFDHSDKGVLETCNGFLDQLQEMGAELVDIKLKHLNECMLAHSITIGSEHLSSMASACRLHSLSCYFKIKC
jgi:Asp-tRNA(Asn)/Glu-tRNA(Gln) amidotransferase A subunit family amidase